MILWWVLRCCCLSVAFLFNWIGFFLSFCLTTSAAGRYGAISGFGLSLIKWVLIVRVRASLHELWMWTVARVLIGWLPLFAVFHLLPRLLWRPVLAVVGVLGLGWVSKNKTKQKKPTILFCYFGRNSPNCLHCRLHAVRPRLRQLLESAQAGWSQLRQSTPDKGALHLLDRGRCGTMSLRNSEAGLRTGSLAYTFSEMGREPKICLIGSFSFYGRTGIRESKIFGCVKMPPYHGSHPRHRWFLSYRLFCCGIYNTPTSTLYRLSRNQCVSLLFVSFASFRSASCVCTGGTGGPWKCSLIYNVEDIKKNAIWTFFKIMKL